MAYQYSDYVNSIANLLILLETITAPTTSTPSTDPNFNQILPRGIEYAEQRMYRELDLIQTFTTATASTAAANRAITVPPTLIVMNSAYLITPAGSQPDDPMSSRNTLIRVSPDFLNAAWSAGSASDATGIPKWYADKDNTTVWLAPAPNDNYNIEFLGTVRPTPLSPSNPTTLLTTYLPDVFLACSMVFFSGYQRDYGAMSDDPKLAQSWEQQYQTLKASAIAEIARAKSQSDQWTPFSKATQATADTRGAP